MFCKHLVVAIAFPVIFNAFIVVWELTFFGEPYWLSVLTVGIGELVVMILGYILYMTIAKRNKAFLKILKADQNLEFKF